MNLDRNGAIELAARNWVEEVFAIERGLQSIQPSRILTIRYERLLEAPEETLFMALTFMGLDAPSAYISEVRNVGLRVTADKWKRSLSAAELSSFERVAESPLRKLYYLAD